MNEDEKSPPLLSGWRFIALVATLVLSIVGYFLFTILGGWDKVMGGIANIGIKGIALSLSLTLIAVFFRFLRWNYFLHNLGYHIPFLSSLRIYISGFTLTTTPGKAGEALRSVFLGEYGVPYRTSFGALLAERLSDLLAVVLLSLGGLLAYPQAKIIVAICVVFIFLVLYVVQKDNWLRAIERFVNKKFKNQFAHIIEFAIETILAFRNCFTIHVFLIGAFFGCLAWATEGVILYYILQILKSHIPLYTAIFIHAFSLLIGALTFLPGGLGGAEATMYNLLLFNHVSSFIAVTATLILRLCTLWFCVFLGLVVLPKKILKFR